MESLTLLELNRQIAEVIAYSFDEYVWVVAEVSEMKVAYNGHCYLELIEKSKRNNTIVARQRATIWANRWQLIKETFESSTGQHLAAGIKVLVCVQIQMHEAYGISLNIVDIDPSFTIGDMALRRQEIIKRLTDEGMIDMNKELAMPVAPQRIAVISAENAAGYQDFCHQLANNEAGAVFYHTLFPASMQGKNTEASIIEALDRIYSQAALYDAVVIIRGGGGVSDLASFDSYDLAVNIANFPLPIVVGIGHEKDVSVLDIVAHTSVKTPTAAAEVFIDMLSTQLSMLDQYRHMLSEVINSRRERENNRVARNIMAIKNTHIKLREQINRTLVLKERVTSLAQHAIEREKQHCLYLEKTIDLTNPHNVLERGYSITRINGHAIKDASQLKEGQVVETQTAKGIIKSIVSQTHN